MYRSLFKPLFDFLISFFIIIFLFPVILVIWVCVYLNLGRPVLFCQNRPGKNEKIFKLYKFRTMLNEFSATSELLPDSERLTRFGKFLRKTSLDELPQLFNVLTGDISLVGPRPLLIEYLPLYSEEQRIRHQVKPGITGWAQVNGRNAITWEEKFKLDVFYVENISIQLDLKILFRTFIKVVSGSGIYNKNGVTMDKFGGSKK